MSGSATSTGVKGQGNLIGVHAIVASHGLGVIANTNAVLGENLAIRSDGVGVQGTCARGIGVQGQVPSTLSGQPNTTANTIAVQGMNQSTGAGGIGVQGTSANGLGGSFQGGVGPLRLVPGALSARTLTPSGHQAGEIYVTSDARLFFFGGTNWREVVLAEPGSGVPPAAAARPSASGNPTGSVQPAPPPRSG